MMEFSLFYFDDAKLDVREAKNWYKKQKEGLEKRFADAIKEVLYTIQNNPFSYELRYKNIRIGYTKIFPFGIHFYINETKSQIVIIAVLHCKRNPAEVQDR